VRLRPKLRAHGFHTFDPIPRLNPSVARTKFSCLILGNADTADNLLLTEWLDKLREAEGHVASLELAHAHPTFLPSMGGSRESLIRRQRTLAQPSSADLIMDISNVRRHLLEGFSRCSPTTRPTHNALLHLALERSVRSLECTQHSVHSKS